MLQMLVMDKLNLTMNFLVLVVKELEMEIVKILNKKKNVKKKPQFRKESSRLAEEDEILRI
jgi:hypothetical protein